MQEVFVGFSKLKENVTIRCFSVCTGLIEAGHLHFASYIFWKQIILLTFTAFFFFFFPHLYQSLSLAQKRRITICSNERATVPAETAFSTGLVIVCLRENGCLSSERFCDGREVIVAEGERCTLPLCEFFFCCGSSAAGGLKRVPHESGSGTAALSGDKVIRTGNNERERKS